MASSPVTMSQSPIVTLRQESTSKPSVLRLSMPLRTVTPPTATFSHPWKKQLQQLMSRNVTSRTATSRHSMNTISCPGRPWCFLSFALMPPSRQQTLPTNWGLSSKKARPLPSLTPWPVMDTPCFSSARMSCLALQPSFLLPKFCG